MSRPEQTDRSLPRVDAQHVTAPPSGGMPRWVTAQNKQWWTLGAACLGLFMIMLDSTVVNVALPSIQRSLHLGVSDLEWVVAGYALVFAAFMLTGGRLADLLGRRRVLMAGLVIFTGASLACGLAPNSSVLVGARVAQGLGAALINPATLAIITATFPASQRGRALGIWASISATGLAIGPLVGGLFSEHLSWNWIFFLNVPVGIAALLVAPVLIDESRDTSRERRPDVPGLATSAIGLLAVSYALIEANTYGWSSARILGAFALGTVALAAFLTLELRQNAPMLDLSLFRDRTFVGANIVMLLLGLAMLSSFFYVSLYMQNVLRYSPVKTGAAFLPLTLMFIVIAPRAGRLSDRFGSRTLVVTGMTLISIMLLYDTQLGAAASIWLILPGALIGGIGMALTMTPTTAAAIRVVPVTKAGVGSAVLSTMRQLGGSVGMAIIGAVVASGQSASLRAGNTPPIAYLHGFHDAAKIAALLALTGAAVALCTLRSTPRTANAPTRVLATTTLTQEV